MQITTEITSSKIPSDNPIHQRLLFAYHSAIPYLQGEVLELGCGEGRGLDTIAPYCNHYTALDKNAFLLKQLKERYSDFDFIETTFPPVAQLPSESADTIIAFQVIEHIQKDELFIEEVHRVLRKGGKALISTPNKELSLTRNPWHVREYTPKQLFDLVTKSFSKVLTFGITGDEKVWQYYDNNRKSVQKITRWDILNLQYLLPAPLLRIPYDYLNRKNRNKLMIQSDSLVSGIQLENYSLTSDTTQAFDLFYVLEKK